LSRSTRPRLEAIRLDRVSLQLGRHRALREVALELRAGERWMLVGPNGAGKTVLLKLLRGDLWPAPDGHGRRRYRLDGQWQDTPLEARERIAYLGPERQDRYDRYGLDARVAEIVATGFTGDDLLLEVPTPRQWQLVMRALADVGLAGLANRRFLTLSHGQRRRVLLSRAMLGRPDVLLLDEVLNGLDASSRRAFLRALDRASTGQLAWILSTHRASERPRGLTHLARIDDGRVSVHRVDAPAGKRAMPRAAAAGRRGAASGPSCEVSPAPLLALERVRVYRDGQPALGPLDWTIEGGEHWHVAGPNGAGKSTLIALLYGDLSPADGGRIERRGFGHGTPIEAWKRHVGLVSPELQSIYAATACSALEIVVSGLRSSIGLATQPTSAERRRARRWLQRVGLAGLEARRARELSYGQLRRALLARAFVAERKMLLLDEPFDGLDAPARLIIGEQLAIAAKNGAQIVIATHHEDDVPTFVTRRLDLGRRGRRASRVAERAGSVDGPARGRAGAARAFVATSRRRAGR
jgi:molybdate transport system ATP-binding protein